MQLHISDDRSPFLGFSNAAMHTKPIEFSGTSAWIIDERLCSRFSPRFVKLYVQTHGKTATKTMTKRNESEFDCTEIYESTCLNGENCIGQRM